MAQLTNERIIRNATASLEIEGFTVEDKYKFLCNKLLKINCLIKKLLCHSILR